MMSFMLELLRENMQLFYPYSKLPPCK